MHVLERVSWFFLFSFCSVLVVGIYIAFCQLERIMPSKDYFSRIDSIRVKLYVSFFIIYCSISNEIHIIFFSTTTLLFTLKWFISKLMTHPCSSNSSVQSRLYPLPTSFEWGDNAQPRAYTDQKPPIFFFFFIRSKRRCERLSFSENDDSSSRSLDLVLSIARDDVDPIAVAYTTSRSLRPRTLDTCVYVLL